MIRHKAACQAWRCETKGACVSMNIEGDENVLISFHDSTLSDDGTVITGIAGAHDQGPYSRPFHRHLLVFVYFVVSFF